MKKLLFNASSKHSFNPLVAFFSTAVILIAETAFFLESRFSVPTACAQPLGFVPGFDYLTIDEIIELPELDHATVEPIVKRLLKQRILAKRQERFTLNKHLEKINKMLM